MRRRRELWTFTSTSSWTRQRSILPGWRRVCREHHLSTALCQPPLRIPVMEVSVVCVNALIFFVGLMERRPPRERKVPGSNPACAGIFSGLSLTCDLNICTPVATLPGAWRYRVSAGTGWPGVSMLWLGKMESWICNFYLSVAAREIEQIRPWDTLACCWDVKQPTNKQTCLVDTSVMQR